MRLVRGCAIAVTLVCALVALAPPLARGDGDGDIDAYSVRVSPASVAGGSPARFDVVLTNKSSPGSTVGSVNLRPPAGFRIVRASLPADMPGSAAVRRDVVELRHLVLEPNTSVRVSVTASSPERCGRWTYRWIATVREGSDFTGEPLLPASPTRLTTTAMTSCVLVFGIQPHSAIVSEHITGASYDPSGPAVSVKIVDARGRIVRSASAPVTISLGNNPGDAVLAGTSTVRATRGVALFYDLALDRPASGYTFRSSSATAKGATSGAFDENNAAVACSQDTTCSTSVSTSTSTVSVTATPNPTKPNVGTLTESVDEGSPLACEGYTPVDANWFGYAMSTPNRSKRITYQIEHVPFTRAREIDFCFGAPYEFTTRSGALAPAGTLPDGESGFIGLLPPCSRVISPPGTEPLTEPCVDARAVMGDGARVTVVLTIDVPTGLPGDPWGRV